MNDSVKILKNIIGNVENVIGIMRLPQHCARIYVVAAKERSATAISLKFVNLTR